MSAPLNVKDALTRVRQRIHDLNSRVFQDDEILAVFDDELRGLFTRMRSAGQSWGIDRFDVPLGSFVPVEAGTYELDLPDYVFDIQLIEGVVNANAVPIPNRALEQKDLSKSTLGYSVPGWIWSRYGHTGSIQIRGSWTTTLPVIRIWFLRQIGPMVYGTSSGGSTTTITPAVVTGAHKARVGLYDNMMLEVTADSGGAANVGQIRRIATFAGGVFTLTSALPAAASATTQWAMLLPLPPDVPVAMFLEAVALHLFARTANAEEVQIHWDNLARLRKEFENNITNRSTGEPKRVYSSRGR